MQPPKGPRLSCSLGSLAPGPPEPWRALARQLEASVAGPLALEPPDPPMPPLGEQGRPGHKRPGQQPGATVVVDRGLASAETLAQIQAHGLHDMVAGRPAERTAWRAEGEEADWSEGLRTPSPRHPAQKKSQGQGQRRRQGNEGALVGLREGRQE